MIGTGAIALAEQARFVVEKHREWLARREGAAPSPVAALLASLVACGLHREDQLEAAWVIARLPVVVAEGLATPAASFRDYPLNLPEVRYEEEP